MNSLASNNKIASATQQGTSHMANGNKPCQDIVLVDNLNDTVFLGLADGAGSKKNSQHAAKVILDALFIELTGNLYYYLKSKNMQKELTKFIEDILYIEVKGNKLDFEEMASTLLLVIVYKDKYLLLHIGDGLIVSIDEEDKFRILSLPENGTYENETYFINTVEYKERLRISQGDRKDIANGLLLCSDGIEDLIYNYQTLEVSPLVRTMIDWLDTESEKYVSEILAYNLEKNFSQKSDDDLSIIIYKEITDESV
jgi:serine/threonine protein phosphatase PrpC